MCHKLWWKHYWIVVNVSHCNVFSHPKSLDYGKACKCSFLYLVLSEIHSQFQHHHYDCVEKPLRLSISLMDRSFSAINF